MGRPSGQTEIGCHVGAPLLLRVIEHCLGHPLGMMHGCVLARRFRGSLYRKRASKPHQKQTGMLKFRQHRPQSAALSEQWILV